MKKKLIIIISSFLVVIFGIILTIVIVNSNKKITLTNTLEDTTFVYDGEKKSLAVTGDIPDGVTVSYTNNEQTEPGTYDVSAKLSDGNKKYNDLFLNARLSITKADLDLKLKSQAYEYDGLKHSLSVEGDIPDGVNVTYSKVDLVDVGTYDISATIVDTKGHYNDLTLNAKLTILSKDSGISFTSKEVVYDTLEHSLLVTGDIPSDVSVTYSSNKFVNVGSYEVTATFGGKYENYNIPKTITATLTINKADLDVNLLNETITYDKSNHSLSINKELANNFIVTYDNNSHKDAGIYKVKCTIEDNNGNYNTLSLEANLEITKAKMTDNVSFDDKTVVYDGNIHTILVEGLQNDEISVTYEDNSKKDVGVYNAYAIFESRNYITYDDLRATLIIQSDIKKTISFDNKTIAYDNRTHKLVVDGDVPKDLSITYDKSDFKDVGTYQVVATLYSENPVYSYPETMTATLTIEYSFNYTTNQNKTFKIDSLKDYTHFYIPLKIGDYSFAEYDSGVFSNNLKIEGLEFDSNISLVNFAENMFENDINLVSVKLPQALTVINAKMFKGCTSLPSIKIPTLVNNINTAAFEGCTSLKNITFPATAEFGIGARAFKDCKALENLIIPGNCNSVRNDSFVNCNLSTISFKSLNGVYDDLGTNCIINNNEVILGSKNSSIADSITTIGSNAFYGVDIETINLNQISTIKNSAFKCSNLKYISIPNSCNTIEGQAFADCANLENMIIGSGVTTISDEAFAGTNIANIAVNEENAVFTDLNSNGIFITRVENSTTYHDLMFGFKDTSTSTCDTILGGAYQANPYITTLNINSKAIESLAIYKNPNLKTINIGERVEISELYPIVDNESLESIIVSDNNQYYDSRDNSNAFIETSSNTLIAGGASSVIPDGILIIGDNAFTSTKIKNLYIPSSVTTISEYAFQNCKELESIVVDSNNLNFESNNSNVLVKKSGTDLIVIVGCKNSVIYNGVSAIDKYAFYNIKIGKIYLPNSIILIDENAFYEANITSILYEGSEADFNNIIIDPNSGLDLSKVSISYNC